MILREAGSAEQRGFGKFVEDVCGLRKFLLFGDMPFRVWKGEAAGDCPDLIPTVGHETTFLTSSPVTHEVWVKML
ncbi:hypothetical protein CapIbe_004189 [Capra ibex]